MRNIKITQEDNLPAILDWALAGNKTLALSGNNSKAALGRPMTCDANVSLAGLTGVELHEPAELVMRAKAGTPLIEIQEKLDGVHQRLAFSPPDYGPLLGGPAGQATLGGIFACNLSGSNRIKTGAARDHLLGVAGFTGRGTSFQAGGRVMKNVTGFDLCKLVAGSYGTLVACTSFTFKVLPRPEKARTVLVFGLDVAQASVAMKNAMSSIHEVTAAAYLPADIAQRSGVSFLKDENKSVLAVKVEGPAPSAEYRCLALRSEMAALGKVEELHGKNSRTLWSFVSDVKAFVDDQSTIVWKISLPPASTPGFLARLEKELPEAEYYLDWAGGLIWLSVPSGTTDGGVTAIRGNLHGEGHATLIRGDATLRASIAPFQPQNSVLAGISERIRHEFDPSRIFNPLRMYADEGK